MHNETTKMTNSQIVRSNYLLCEKGLCISKRKEEFIYTRNRFAPSIDRGVQNQA